MSGYAFRISKADRFFNVEVKAPHSGHYYTTATHTTHERAVAYAVKYILKTGGTLEDRCKPDE